MVTWVEPLITPAGSCSVIEPLRTPSVSSFVFTSESLYLSKSDIWDSVIVIWFDDDTKVGLSVISVYDTEPLSVRNEDVTADNPSTFVCIDEVNTFNDDISVLEPLNIPLPPNIWIEPDTIPWGMLVNN